MDNQALQEELTDAFIAYQYRLENPFPSATETKEARILKYRTDPIFHAKVASMVSGVMHIVGKHARWPMAVGRESDAAPQAQGGREP